MVSFLSPAAWATMTFVSATGVSNSVVSETGQVTLYGGFTDGCSGDGANNTQTCDSCISTSGLKTCNYKNAYDALKVTLTLTSTAASGATGTEFYIESGTRKLSTFSAGAPVIGADGTIVAQITWGEICSVLKTDGTSSCAGNGLNAELTLGVKNTANSTTDTAAIQIRVRYEVGKASTVYEDCPPTASGSPSATSNFGLCHFKVERGDEKLYADPTILTENYPASTISGIDYAGVVFYYAPFTGVSDDDTILSINSKTPSSFIGVNITTKKLTDNRITGLTNGTRYCVLAGNQDLTGIISNFTPIPGSTSSSPAAADLCNTPTKVVGLLDDKNCFIATAAFGSAMAPEVESFRKFRNRYLLSNSAGRMFVKFYYKHSPAYAHMIAENETMRTLVRGSLWPLLMFSRLALDWGIGLTLGGVALLGVVTCGILRRLFQRRLGRAV